jgi:hypothetical protein
LAVNGKKGCPWAAFFHGWPHVQHSVRYRLDEDLRKPYINNQSVINRIM